METKDNNEMNNTLNSNCLQHPDGAKSYTWETLIFYKNGSFSIYFMPKIIKKIKCLIIRRGEK